MPQQSIAEYIRHGQTPFFRLPTRTLDFEDARPVRELDAAILGVPFDGGTTYQPGARFAPYQLRRVSALVQPYHMGHDFDVFAELSVADVGNIPVSPFNAAATREIIEVGVSTVVAGGAVPFVVGGDHSITLPCLRAVSRCHGPVALVHLDAHFDTTAPGAWMELFHHGTPIRNALGEGLISPGGLVQVGLRGSWKGDDDDACTRKYDGRIVTAGTVAARGVEAVAASIRDQVGDRPTYLSIDIDVVDPAFAPGTGTPVPGGLTSREVLGLVGALRGIGLVGMDLVEVAPALDHADITSLLGAHLLFEALALLPRR
jgi:agmatinase